MHGFVYITKNNLNQSYYVGQTTCFYKPHYIGSGDLIIKAIKKYGKHNFSCSPIQYASSQSELDCIEKYYIGVFRESGLRCYNISSGGLGGRKGVEVSMETRAKMRMAKLGRKQPRDHVENMKKALRARRPHQNSLDKLKELSKLRIGVKNPKLSEFMKGRPMSDAAKIALEEYRRSDKFKHNMIKMRAARKCNNLTIPEEHQT